MLPIFWKYLSKSYLRFFLLSVLGFIALLLVMRLKEIARFTALASNPFSVFAFISYQIPHILPIALPISCLISAIILFQNLSKTHQLTALRTGGLSLFQIAFPIFLLSAFIAICNFFITSEIAPVCRRKSKEFISQASSINPLMLLQRKNLLRIKNAFIDMHYKNSSSVKDLFFIIPNKANEQLNCLYAHELKRKNNRLIGKNLSLIAYLKNPQENNFDTLIVENQDMMTTDADALSHFMKSFHWNLTLNSLPMHMLLTKAKLSKKLPKKIIQRNNESIAAEIGRRLAFAFSAFSLTFIGIAFGMDISRFPSKKKIVLAVSFALIILISLVIGKALKHYALPALIAYILPQPLIILWATLYWKKTIKGIE